MRFPPPRIALALAFLLATATACSSGDDSSEPADTSAPAAASTSSPPPPTTRAGAPRVVLDDPGAEPRQALVLRLTPGTLTQVVFESRLGLEMTIDGIELPTGDLPVTSVTLEEVIDRVDPDGTVHFTATFREVEVVAAPGSDPDVVSQSQASLSQLEGLRGKGTFDAHGGNQTLTFETGGITSPPVGSTIDSISSQVGNLSAPFPDDPVGVGARWTSTATAKVNGITMNTTTHYTLRSRTGDQYEIDYTQEAEAPPGPASFPNLPAGTRASITSFTLRSTGGTTGDLTRHLPLTGTASGSGDGTFSVTVGAEQAELVEHLTVDFSLASA